MSLLADVLRIGTRAAQPAATAVSPATLYAVSDEDFLIEQSDGATWSQYGPTPSGGGGGDFDVLARHTYGFYAGLMSGGSYGIAPLGETAVTIAGSANARLVKADNMWFDFVTAAAGTAQARMASSAFTLFQRRHDIDFQVLVTAPTTLTSIRLWIGLTSLTFPDADTHTGHCAAFRFSSVAGDTGWRPCVRDGATQTTGTNIGTVTAGQEYLLRIRCVLAGTPTVYFSVDGGTEQAITANLPGASTDIGYQLCVIAQTASARNFSVCRGLITWGAAVP